MENHFRHGPSITSPRRDLFFASFLFLFLELAFIRWLPSQVLFLTFFTNIVLMACFLGVSIGCLAAARPWSWINLFVPLTLGLGPIVAIFQTLWHRTGKENWLRLTRFFGTLFLVAAASSEDDSLKGMPLA